MTTKELAKKLLGSNIQHYRDVVGMTQQTLADKINVESGGYISNIENGKRWPRPDVLQKVAKALKVDVKDLFDPKTAKTSSSSKTNHEKWAAKFETLFKKMKDEDIQNLYDYVKKTYRK